MTDFFLALSDRPQTKKIVQALGLPLPLPEPLHRADSPIGPNEVSDLCFAASAIAPGKVWRSCAQTLAHTQSGWVEAESLALPFESISGRAKVVPAPVPAEVPLDVLVFDASGMSEPGQLDELYEFFSPRLGQLEDCGRIVVIGSALSPKTSAAQAAAHSALEGFVRSLAKEVGAKGITANLVSVARGHHDVSGVLAFLISERAAFVTGQVIKVGAAKSGAPKSDPFASRSLQGQTALVTGAARGIGAETCRRLAEEGAKVIGLDLPADCEQLTKVMTQIGGIAFPFDLLSPDCASALSELALEEGGFDIVVHNAGVTRDKTLKRMPKKHWNQALDVNLRAIIPITESLAENGLNDGARIICLSSVAGIAGNRGQSNYAAAKSGVLGLVSAWARDFKGRNITVNAIAPGFIETRLTAAIPIFIREAARRLSSLSQGGQPVDIAEGIVFLASNQGRFVSGTALRICGGAFIGA